MAEDHSAAQAAAVDFAGEQQGWKLAGGQPDCPMEPLGPVSAVGNTAVQLLENLDLNDNPHGSPADAAAADAAAAAAAAAAHDGESSPTAAAAKPAAAAGSQPDAPAAPPTPVEQRQWLRAAQRSVRLAVTAFKDARSRAGAANSQGTSVATQLSNDLLTEQNIQGIELPDVLKQVPGLQQAAVAKLQRRQQQHLQDLAQAVSDFAQAVEDMAEAFKDVTAQLSPATTESGDGTGPDSSSSGNRWHCNAPVFNSLTLPEALRMLQQVLSMHEKELCLKNELLACFEKMAGGMASGASSNASSSSSHAVGGSGRLKVDGPDGLSRQLTAAVTTWMVRPFVDDDVANHLLQVLTDDMTGF